MDLTQYHIAYKNKFEAATASVKKSINDFNNRKCCDTCEGSILLGMAAHMTKFQINSVSEMMAAMFFSSGYFSRFEVSKKKNCDYLVKFYMKKMTDEEKKDALEIPDDTEQSDPVAEPMD